MLREIREILAKGGFEIGEPIFKSISFDLIAKGEHMLLILKALLNIDALRSEVARELKILAKELKASPLVIGKKSAMGDILDGVIYSRHGIPILSLNTFREFVLEGEYPMVYASPGGFYVNINGKLLRKIREERGISLGQLAKIAGVSRKTIQLYEEGMNATVESALRLEEFLNVPLIQNIDILDFNKYEEERYPHPPENYGDIYRKLIEIGYEVFLTFKCPFDVLSKDERDVFLTGIGNDIRKIKYKAINLKILSNILEKNSFIVVEKSRYEEIEGVPIIEKAELMEIEKKEEIRKIVRERSAI